MAASTAAATAAAALGHRHQHRTVVARNLPEYLRETNDLLTVD